MIDPIPHQIAVYCDDPEVPECCDEEMILENDEFNGYWYCHHCDSVIEI